MQFTGIGYQIVLALAQRGCRVIIVDKTEDCNLLENIFKETNSRNVVFKRVDLSSFDSVRALAQDVNANEEKLDILINNAGLANVPKVTENGFNIVLQVNYLSAFLLTHLVIGEFSHKILLPDDGLTKIHLHRNVLYRFRFAEESEGSRRLHQFRLFPSASFFTGKIKTRSGRDPQQPLLQLEIMPDNGNGYFC